MIVYVSEYYNVTTGAVRNAELCKTLKSTTKGLEVRAVKMMNPIF